MIAKHIAMNSVSKSDFADLVAYMTDEQNKNERVGFVSLTNCQSYRVDEAVLEVINTQDKNKRSESDKTFHLIVSFPAGEQPDDVILKQIEERLCEGLGFGEHQRISVIHHDTDNLHIHIAINKIHPTRYTILDPYYSHKVLGQLCEKLEQEYGLTPVNHKANNVRSENRAFDMEHHAGVESLLGWIKRECLEQMQAAGSWADMHKVMQKYGLQLNERGNGLVISDQDGLMVKASSVARDLSKKKLEEKLGSFSPLSTLYTWAENPKSQYEARPLKSRIDTTLLFARYKKEQQDSATDRTKEWRVVREHKDRQIEQVKQAAKLKRSATKLMGGSRIEKKLLYAMISSGMRKQIVQVNAEYRQKRETIFNKYQAQQWADWLRSHAVKGDKEALEALRSREVSNGLKGNTMSGSGLWQPHNEVGMSDLDSVTKTGNIIYRAGASAVRDDGNKLSVSKGAGRDTLHAALRMAMAKYGSQITVNGTTAFKEKIVKASVLANLPIFFTDASLERKRQFLLNTLNEVKDHDESRNKRGRGQDTGRGISGSGSSATRRASIDRSGSGRFTGFSDKPNIGRVGHQPPPESRNRLRNLSDVSVVGFAGGSEVLLPSNVPNHLDNSATQPDNALRRPLSWARLDSQSVAVASQYIKEINLKRVNVLDILRHKLFTESDSGQVVYAGVRHIEGISLALFKQQNEMIVMPIDDSFARKLNRLAIGDSVTISQNGSIKTNKGRGR
jgi:hypothetical protein